MPLLLQLGEQSAFAACTEKKLIKNEDYFYKIL